MKTKNTLIETIHAYDLLIKNQNEVIRALKIYPKVLNKDEHKHLHSFFNIAMYTSLACSDLIVGLKYLDVSMAVKNEIEANIFARMLAHSSYEILNSQQKIIGKETINKIAELIGEDEVNNLNLTMKELRPIRRDYFEKLKEIRNELFGHRNIAGLIMSEKMVLLNYHEIYKIADKIYKWESKVLDSIMNLITKI